MSKESKVNERHLPKLLYQPTFHETQLTRFTKFVQQEHSLEFKDYWELRDWSIENYADFWACLWNFYELKCSQSYSTVYEKNTHIYNGTWFTGMYLNYAENILRYRDSKIALITMDDYDDSESITFAQLYDEVKVYAKALRRAGVQKGDFVTCCMTHKKEAIFAYLAATSIGATWAAALPQVGKIGILSRFQQIKPKVLFMSGNFVINKTEVNMEEKMRDVVLDLPSIEKVVFVSSKMNGKKMKGNVSGIKNCVHLEDFLAAARVDLEDSDSDLLFEQVAFQHPVCISFTSGTTGTPKALVHTNAFLLTSMKDYGLAQNISRDDVFITITPSGWNIWNLSVCCLRLGCTLVVYEGDPMFGHRSPTRFWDLVDRFAVTTTFVKSMQLEELEERGYLPGPSNSLKSLRQIVPAGSTIRLQSYDFITEKIKPGIFCSPIYGTTECYGLISGLDHNLPTYKGEIQLLSLGMDVRILDEHGATVIGEMGDLVIANPYPSLPIRMLNDPDNKKLTSVYLDVHPGYWNTGDSASINPITKGLIVFGRQEEGIPTIGGKVWSSEINSTLVGLKGIVNTVYVQHISKKKGKRIILFVKMSSGEKLTPEIKQYINKHILDHLTIFYIPDIILQAPDIPYNLTGKKLNNVVKMLINKEPLPKTDTIVNPSSLEYFEELEIEDL